MPDLNIIENQGLTQALKDYALKNNLISDASEISKEEWDNTIFKLKEIQDSRKTNNKDSIFSEGSEYDKTTATNNDWHKNFVVNKGTVTLSDEELQSLMKTMGANKPAVTNTPPANTPPVDTPTVNTPPANTPPVVPPKDAPPVAPPATQPNNQVTSGEIETDSANGTYTISPGNENKGFKLTKSMTVSCAIIKNKFFGGLNLTQDKKGNYTCRGLKSQDYNILQQLVLNKANELTADNEIYKNLQAKSKKENLTDAEESFMDYYVNTELKEQNLALDKDFNIVESSQNTNKRKKFLGIF